MTRLNRRTLAIATGWLVAIAVMAGCRGTPPPGPPSEQEERATPPAKNNLVVEAGGPSIARIRVEVTGPDFKGTLRFDIPAKGGFATGGIGVPAGSLRTIQLTAFDADGRVTHHGAVVERIVEGINPPFAAELLPTGGGEPVRALIGTYRVQLDSAIIPGKEGDTLRFTGQLIGGDGASVPVDRTEVRWEIDPGGWPSPPKLFPCPPLDSGGAPLCAELHPPLKHKPEIVLCLKDVFCRAWWRSKEYNVRVISAGWLYHACAVMSWGAAYCWGGNGSGQLGTDTPAACQREVYAQDGSTQIVPYKCSRTPVSVRCGAGDCDFTTITAGASHTCALDRNQEAWCWGGNVAGQLGLGTLANPGGLTPVKVTGGLKFTDISAGRYFTCALATTEDVYCWGDNTMAAVGSATVSSFVTSPTKVSLTEKARLMVAGGDHACAVETTGQMFCWGLNQSLQLDGKPASLGVPWCGNCSASPLLVQAGGVPSMQGKVADRITAGSGFTCAHVTTGETNCWGNLVRGQTGGLPATTNVEWLSAGWDQVCFISTGAGFCWGLGNNGQLGSGQFIPVPISPAPVNLTPVAILTPPYGLNRVDSGLAFTCGIDASKDHVYCWGANQHGQLGDGTNVTRATPTKVVFK